MSQQEVDKVIQKAIEDSKFRDNLLDDPKSACADFDITDEELSALVKSAEETFAGDLDVRVSKRKMGKFGGFSGPMGIDDIVE